MAKTHLTDAAVERYRRPHAGRTEVSDSEPGLFLWITPNGVKSWAIIYRLADAGGLRTQRRKSVVGRFPAMDVTAARQKARHYMRLAADGVDPEMRLAQEKLEAERAATDQQAGTFRAVAEDYIAAMKSGQLVGGRKRAVTQTTAVARERLLEQRVFPTLGSCALSDITTPMVARLLTQLDKSGGPVDETLKVVRGVFKFALSRGLFNGALPTTGMTNRQPPKKITRALTDDELRAIWQAASEQGWPFGAVIKLLMLTGQRKNEIAGLMWEEVDLERKLIVLPKERVKNRKGAHEVALSVPAIQLLEDASAVYDALHRPANTGSAQRRSGLVFPSDTGATPISGWNKLKAALDRRVKGNLVGLSEEDHRAIRAGGALRADTVARKKAALAQVANVEMVPWRIHDLRHTFITRCRDGDENADGEITWSAPIEVLQAAVNHEITVGVTKAYDHGDLQKRYRLRKRELMDWWALKLVRITGGIE
ncbi:site-specific integrase [Sphingomonas limnosediminicola]|uniref:Site-specific integrase n=1 Tax=Sphingomonas limnosediminicola TaxID=940133 RepID=A0ABP7KWA3_9SPHN